MDINMIEIEEEIEVEITKENWMYRLFEVLQIAGR